MFGPSWNLKVLNPNFRDMLSALNEAEVEYLVVGAYAMASHGCPRATGDIDFWVRPTKANAERIWSALIAFGASARPKDLLDVQILDAHSDDPKRL